MLDTIVLNIGYVLLISAAFTRTLGRLRFLLVFASLALALYGAIVGVLSMVLWNALIGSVHAYRLARDILASRAIQLTDDERRIRDEYFAGVNDFDFNALWGMGRTVEHPSDTTIIGAGTQPESVSMLLEGKVEIQRDGVAGPNIGRGALIGEMSYVSGAPASVDVVAADAVVVREWDQRHLRTLEQTNPPSAKALDSLISRDLAAKARG